MDKRASNTQTGVAATKGRCCPSKSLILQNASVLSHSQEHSLSWAQQLTPVILATQEAEIRRIKVQGHPRQKVCKTSSQPQWLGIVVYACYPRYTEGLRSRLV
jgi:hypothetical protein